MALRRYSEVRGLTGWITADVRLSGVKGFEGRKRVVDISVGGDCQLMPEDWEKFVAEVNQLLAPSEGSVDSTAGGS